MNEQVIQPYYNVICSVRLTPNQQYTVDECLYFTGIDKILVGELYVKVHDVIIRARG